MVADGSGRGSLDLSLDGDLADLARERPIRICAHALREGCVFHVLPRAGGIRECCPVRLLLKNLDFLIKNLFFFILKTDPLPWLLPGTGAADRWPAYGIATARLSRRALMLCHALLPSD